MIVTRLTRRSSYNDTIYALKADLGFTSHELGEMLKVSPRTIDRWQMGLTVPQHAARARINDLRALYLDVAARFTSWAAALTWMDAENVHLGRFTPREALRLGHTGRFLGALASAENAPDPVTQPQ